MSTREEIKKLINLLEEEYGVTEWRHNGYYIWPVLRISLYMHLVKTNEKGRGFYFKGANNPFVNLFKAALELKKIIFTKKKIESIFISAPSFCVMHKGKIYNRFFDVLMDQEQHNSLYFNKSHSKKGVYQPQRHILFASLLTGFSYFNKVFNVFAKESEYVNKLCQILKKEKIDVNGFEDKANRFLRTVDLSYQLSFQLLKRIKPKNVWALCYYSADIMGFFIAAQKLSIRTIDLQHGGQGGNHLAYSSWAKLPVNGYEALPDYFYTWDRISAINVNNWTVSSNKHLAKEFGNPWVKSWKTGRFGNSGYDWPENIMLYSLQPIDEPLEPYLLEAIEETKNEWDWWLRIHPRQMNEINDIKLRLHQYDLLENVNILDATRLHLPEILSHTKVHLTKFSGCAIEAYQFGVPSIILDERGVDIYKEYLNTGNLMFTNLDKSSKELVEKIRESIVSFKINN